LANRKKVLKVAEELGYQPDPDVARFLSHIRKKTDDEPSACMALLTSGPEPQAWKLAYTERQYVEGVLERAASYGYRVEEFWVEDPKMPLRRLESILWNRGIEGVLLAPLQGRMGPERVRKIDMDFSRFSVVEISETIQEPNVDRALHDQYNSMILLLNELRNLGYQRIGLVLQAGLDRRVNGKWSGAYLQEGLHHPEAKLKPLLLENGKEATFTRWLKSAEPDVVVSVARFGYRLLEQAGLRIPEDVAYASLDVDGLDREHTFCSGIDQNSKAVGAAAVDLLVAAIQRGETGLPRIPRHFQVEGTWIESSSTPGK
jgi:LacI family transcriptional regulator